MVISIIQPQQLPAVKKALFRAGIKHLTVTNVLGTAPEGAAKHIFRGVVAQATKSGAAWILFNSMAVVLTAYSTCSFSWSDVTKKRSLALPEVTAG